MSETVTTLKTSTESDARHIDLNGNEFHVPTFTMKEIYDAIPRHCFVPSLTRSLAYVARDAFYLTVVTYVAYTYIPLFSNQTLRIMAYAGSTFLSGLVMTGIWILAHECGHGAFSKSKAVNNTVGLLLHSFLMVPYHSWRITHSHHHKATGNLQREIVFVPYTREDWVKDNHGQESDPSSVSFAHLAEDSPIVTLYQCLVHQLAGWPAHMLDNVSSQKGKRGFPQHSHYYFGEDSALFKNSELSYILLSDLGLATMLLALYTAAQFVGWWSVLVFYGIPYLWVNNWIVAITYLQHTDARLPHYENSQWTFARGATATIDRDLGFIDTHLFHDIIGTHVLHHLISTIPFYHAQEATIAIRKVMGKSYQADLETPFWRAFWNNQRDCKFVEESEGLDGTGVFFYRNLHGKGTPPKNLAEDDVTSSQSSLSLES